MREAEERFRTLFENSAIGLYRTTPDGRIMMANRALVEMLGYSRIEDLADRNLEEDGFEPQYPRSAFKKRIESEGEVMGLESAWVRRDGTTLYIRESARAVYDEHGKILYYEGTVEDITDRKEAEKLLQLTQFSTEHSADAAFWLGKDAHFIYVNEAACRALNYSREELLTMSVHDIDVDFPPEVWEAHWQKMKECGSFSLESRHRTKDGRIFPVEVSVNFVEFEGKEYNCAFVRDITERKRVEKELLDDRTKLKSLASQLSLAEERERRRIAVELHDQISQSLIISKIKIEALRQGGLCEEAGDELDEVCKLLDCTIASTRSLTFDLSSPILYELGFESAVSEWFTQEIQKKHGISCEFEDDGQAKPLDDDIRVLLFRNVRELLMNVVKHARAAKVKVSISKADGRIQVSVEDDGVGFDPAAVAAASAGKTEFGLFSVRERLEQLGGHLEIESSPRCGCRAVMVAPLKEPESTGMDYVI